MTQRLHLTVSIVTYNTRFSELAACIDALIDSIEFFQSRSEELKVTIIVVDNGEGLSLCSNESESAEELLGFTEYNIEVIQGHGNVGYGAAQNLAFQQAAGDIHIFMNPDVVLESEAIAEGIDFLRRTPDVVALSPSCTDMVGRKQHLCKRYPSIFDLFLRGFAPEVLLGVFKERLSRYEMAELDELSPTRGVPIISGCFMMCRGNVIATVKGFDPGYFLYFEDFDLSLRLKPFGPLAYVPSVKIKHGGGNASKKGLRHIAMFLRSAIKFFNTHGWKLS